MNRREGGIALAMAIIFMAFSLVIIFLIENVSDNFYQTKQQVIQTKSDQFSKAFLISAANIWTAAASQASISPDDRFEITPSGESSNHFTLVLNKGQETEETVNCSLTSLAGQIYDSSDASKVISIGITAIMTSDLPDFKETESKGLVLELEE